jgi:mono/diheme cytochrome c family protein
MPGDLSFAFKPGAGSQAATAYCLTCHSSAYVSTQPPLDKAHWEAEVTKMRKAFGAMIPDQDAAQIVDYLTATYGKTP